MSHSLRHVIRLSSVALGLAAATSHAAVVSSTPNLLLGSLDVSPTITPVDVDGDGTNDFSFTHTTNPVTIAPDSPFPKADFNGKLTMDAATAGQFLAIVRDADGIQSTNFNSPGYLGNYAETLAIGTTVGPASNLISLADVPPYDNRLLDSSGDLDGGAFSVATGEFSPDPLFDYVAYVGFQLGSNYGYLEFTGVSDDTYEGGSFPFFFGPGDFNGATLAGIGFETSPGTPIVVQAIASVPEPTTLIAIGGLVTLATARRRQRLA